MLRRIVGSMVIDGQRIESRHREWWSAATRLAERPVREQPLLPGTGADRSRAAFNKNDRKYRPTPPPLHDCTDAGDSAMHGAIAEQILAESDRLPGCKTVRAQA